MGSATSLELYCLFPGFSGIYDAKMGTKPLSDVVQLRLLLLEGFCRAYRTLHDGVYSSEIGTVLPGQIVKEAVGLRSTIMSYPRAVIKGSVILLIWGVVGGSPCKEEKVTPCLSHFVRLKSAFKAVSNQG